VAIMPLTKLLFRPGIDKQNTDYGAEGGWVDCDNVRFRYGQPEKIGGWTPAVSNSLIGVSRDIHSYTDLAGDSFAGIGTDRKLYIYFDNNFYDITPLRLTQAATFTFTDGSTTVSVASTAHGARVGDFVTFSSTTGVSVVNFTDADMDAEFEILSVPNTNTFTISVAEIATPGTVTTSGSATAAFQINIGEDTAVRGTGWGAGSWSFSTWGTPRPTGVITERSRIWALDNFGEDLIATIVNGKTYYFDTSAFKVPRNTRATELTNAPTQSNFMLVSSRDRHLIFLGTETTARTTNTYDPMAVLFGDQESLTDFTPTAVNTAGFQRMSSGNQIVTAVRTRGDILILTNTSAHSMQYVGPPFTFGFKQIGTNCGALSSHSAVEAENVVYWMSDGAFFLFDGVVKEIPCSVQDYVFSDLDSEQKRVIYSGVNLDFSEVSWFYPSSGSDYINRVVTFNYLESVWTIGTLARTSWAPRDVFSFPLATEYNPNSTAVAQPTVYGLTQGRSTLYNQESGVNGDGQPITAFITSGDVDIVDGDNSMFVKRYIPDFKNQAGEVEMTFFVRQYPGNAQTTASVTTVYSTSTKIDLRARGRQIAIKILSNDLDTTWRYGTLRIDAQQDGLR
jgi:hypothetical protein